MMENRSFDNLLGWLKSDHNQAIDGISGNETYPRNINDISLGEVRVNRNGYDVAPDDPHHGFKDVAIQINNGSMDGFVYDSLINGLNESNPVSMFD
jgi:phospholipase C